MGCRLGTDKGIMRVRGPRYLGVLMRHQSEGHASRRRAVALAVAVALSASAGSASAQQEPSWTDRMGDFFKRFVPGGGPPEQAQQPAQPQPAQQAPAAVAPAGPPAPAAQAPATRAPAARAPAAQAPTAPAPAAAQAPAGQATPAQQPAAEAPAPPPPARASRPEPSLVDRVGDFFKRLRPGADAPEPAARGSGEAVADEEFDCPAIDIREGASTLMVQVPGETNALSLRYQASFVRAARECIVKGKDVTIKVGLQGRVILGPAGGPGDLKIPVRYALVWEELGRTKMIWSKLYVLPVTIGDQQSNVEFKHVEDDMTVSIPKASELENYMIYIGFDPNGAPIEPRKSPPPKKPKKPPG
jgi:hypothetical protein